MVTTGSTASGVPAALPAELRRLPELGACNRQDLPSVTAADPAALADRVGRLSRFS